MLRAFLELTLPLPRAHTPPPPHVLPTLTSPSGVPSGFLAYALPLHYLASQTT